MLALVSTKETGAETLAQGEDLKLPSERRNEAIDATRALLLLIGLEESLSMKRTFVATLLCGAMMVQPALAGVAMPAPVTAVPASGAVVPAVAGDQYAGGAETAKVIEVRYWRHRHHHHHHHHGGAGAFGAGLAVGIIGALIAKGISESSARERFDRCARDFRSFDYETGTIITRSGEERLCPYLR